MDKLQQTLRRIDGISAACIEKAQARLDNLTKPLGSLGRLEELARQICGITAREAPDLGSKVIFTLAADHGVTVEGVSAYPKEVTAQMVANFIAGGAGINVIAGHVGARVVVADVGIAGEARGYPGLKAKRIGPGTKNMAEGPAMTRDEAVRSVENGIALFEEELAAGIAIAGLGEMGIGNTTPSSAIAAVLTGAPVEEVTGKGTGLDEKGLRGKIAVIKKSIAVNSPDPSDPFDVLAKVGGFEIGGLVGIAIAAAAHKVPVVLDGFISGASALIASHIEPKVRGYLIASHRSVEKGHAVILAHLGLQPLFDLGLRLGEGTGAALGIGLADCAVKLLTRMATFKTAGVSERHG